MAHFAKLNDDNTVGDIIVVANEVLLDENGNEQEQLGLDFIASLGLDGLWVQCSYNGSFRGLYPGRGWRYNSDLDEFVAPIVELTEES